MHCNEKTSPWTLCRIQLTGVAGLEASPCATGTLSRAAIDAWQCPSVPLPKLAIDTEPSFVSLVLQNPNMAPPQSPIANSYCHLHPSNTGKHPESRQAHQGGRVHVWSRIQSHEDEKPERRIPTTYIHHVSSSRHQPINARATLTDPLPRKAKRSDKVPEFQSSAFA